MLQNLFFCILTVTSNCQGTACTLLLFQKYIVCVVDRRHFGSKALPNSFVQQGDISLSISLLLLSPPCVPLPLSPSPSPSLLSSLHLSPPDMGYGARGFSVQRDEFQTVHSGMRFYVSDFLTIKGPEQWQ